MYVWRQRRDGIGRSFGGLSACKHAQMRDRRENRFWCTREPHDVGMARSVRRCGLIRQCEGWTGLRCFVFACAWCVSQRLILFAPALLCLTAFDCFCGRVRNRSVQSCARRAQHPPELRRRRRRCPSRRGNRKSGARAPSAGCAGGCPIGGATRWKEGGQRDPQPTFLLTCCSSMLPRPSFFPCC